MRTHYTLPTIYDLKEITTYPDGSISVRVLMDSADPDYLERRAVTLRQTETEHDTEYRIIARF